MRQCHEFLQVSMNKSREALIKHLARTFCCSMQCAEIRLGELKIQGIS